MQKYQNAREKESRPMKIGVVPNEKQKPTNNQNKKKSRWKSKKLILSYIQNEKITFWIDITHVFGSFIASVDGNDGCDDNVNGNTCSWSLLLFNISRSHSLPLASKTVCMNDQNRERHTHSARSVFLSFCFYSRPIYFSFVISNVIMVCMYLLV